MESLNTSHPLINLRPTHRRGVRNRLRFVAARPIERLLHLDHVNEIFDAARSAGDSQEFLQRTLEFLDVRYQLPKLDLEKIPKTGPLMVVANHPLGALDGIILAAVLKSVRPDIKVMANSLLGRISNLRDVFLFVDPFGNESSSTANLKSMREAIRWLNNGGVLAAFPAGEVASWNLRDRHVVEKPWNETIARIAERANAPVLPIYFDGRNGKLFQAAGVLSPKLRTALLAREITRKRGHQIDVRIGSIIPAKKLQRFEDDAQAIAYLQQHTMLLRHRVRPAPRASVDHPNQKFSRIVPPVNPGLMLAEINSLKAELLLVESGDLQAWCTPATNIPFTLHEIGRLREITFRATGEGTGKSIDLDRFDPDYLHLFVWNKQKHEVVGAYRLGQSDVLLMKRGVAGLYTRTLFEFDQRLMNRVGTSLEMGRSFVRQEYQKQYAPLLMLWKGIATFAGRHPQYKTLFGPVSIRNDYQTISKQLMVRFLQENHSLEESLNLVKPKKPFRAKRISGLEKAKLASDDDDIADLIAELEPDGKGVPVLIRQYLKLGAKFLAFNVDPAFNNSLDGLIAVDLMKADPKSLRRYMGEKELEGFRKYHLV